MIDGCRDGRVGDVRPFHAARGSPPAIAIRTGDRRTGPTGAGVRQLSFRARGANPWAAARAPAPIEHFRDAAPRSRETPKGCHEGGRRHCSSCDSSLCDFVALGGLRVKESRAGRGTIPASFPVTCARRYRAFNTKAAEAHEAPQSGAKGPVGGVPCVRRRWSISSAPTTRFSSLTARCRPGDRTLPTLLLLSPFRSVTF